MNMKNSTPAAALAVGAVVAGAVVYSRTKSSIKLWMEQRKTRDLEKTVDLLNERLAQNPHLITVRFEAA